MGLQADGAQRLGPLTNFWSGNQPQKENSQRALFVRHEVGGQRVQLVAGKLTNFRVYINGP